eukprot:m.137000 g.137000  ORF g.137000 m.137000 type:complete len:94 (+) comp9914_c0_seq4:1050-1331(+)
MQRDTAGADFFVFFTGLIGLVLATSRTMQLASASDDCTVRTWELEQWLRSQEPPSLISAKTFDTLVCGVAWLPKGVGAFVAAPYDSKEYKVVE